MLYNKVNLHPLFADLNNLLTRNTKFQTYFMCFTEHTSKSKYFIYQFMLINLFIKLYNAVIEKLL